VFYIHGLQSHAGWSWEFGEYLAISGVALFVLDRRGSGVSGGERGDYPSVEIMREDYQVAYNKMIEIIGNEIPIVIFGHCLGGSFLAALLSEGNCFPRVAAVIFCSTWLGRLHATLQKEERELLVAPENRVHLPVDLKPEYFTNIAKYFDLINEDPLAIRAITARSRGVFLHAEKLYTEGDISDCSDRIYYIISATDPIVNHNNSYSLFGRITRNSGCLYVIPTNKHYIPFTDARTILFSLTAEIATAGKGGKL